MFEGRKRLIKYSLFFIYYLYDDDISAINHHHVFPCKTCLIIQWMQRYPHPQMRTRRPLPMLDPGQLQTIQAAARNVTQGPI